MAFYYVKSGLTGTGDQGRYASQQTGAFPTTTGGYPTIVAAFGATTPPASGDFICVSDSHTNTTGASQTWAGPIGDSDLPVTIISVSDSACQTYSSGASELAASVGANDINLSGMLAVIGVDLRPADIFAFPVSGSGTVVFCDLSIEFFSGNYFYQNNDGSHIDFINCTLTANNATTAMFSTTQGGSGFRMFGCTIASNSGNLDSIAEAAGQSGGCKFEFYGCDLSIVDTVLIQGVHNDYDVGERAEVIVEQCKMNASTVPFDNSIVGTDTFARVTNSSSVSSEAEYQYRYEARGILVEDESSKYRDGSTAFPAGQKVSLKCTTTAINSTTAHEGWFVFPSRYAQLSNTNTDTVRLYLACANTLDNGDVWVQVIYPDGTNKQIPNHIESITDGYVPTSFRSTSTLDTSTETWTGTGLTNTYQIDLDTSTDAGADCVPIIRLYVAKASETIYFCPTVELTST